MNKFVEKIVYSFGFNASCYNSQELLALKNNLPKNYLHRQLTDIGCGDGQMSLELIKIIKPKSFNGLDASPALIKSAQKKGLSASLVNVETQKTSGDLAILWGVLHHFQNPSKTLKKLSREFNSIIIRESVNDKRIFELGEKFNLNKLLDVLAQAGVKASRLIEIKSNQSVLLFIDTLTSTASKK